MASAKIVISALEIYEAVYDSARSEWVPEDFAGQVADIKDYAEEVWNITLTDKQAEKIANCHKNLLEANGENGQWSLNYDRCVILPLQNAKHNGDDPAKSWGGARLGAGRPATGRKQCKFYLSDEEKEKVKAYIEQIRK